MSIIGIYIIRNKVTNKVYIGQSIDIKKRFREHKSYLKNSNHWNPNLQNICNKYGLDILEFKILENVLKKI
jgi:group I intron endonuclease